MIQANLRDIHREDLGKILDWRNQEFIRNVMFSDSIISWEQHITWYANLLKSSNMISKIFTLDNEDYGILNITDIDLVSNKCNWGFYIGKNNPTKGAGLFLGFTSLEYIFSIMGIRKLCAEVLGSNLISQNFHDKLGFKLDGVLRKHIQRNEKFEDVLLYSIFNDEWQETSSNIRMELEERFKCHKLK
ncbi:UDP-4-amino-4,6-dideoxy-N-acetyl-beta-L-altrosamine N-acetyltransferase [Lysinibacillus endophyticus]|uniref:UDP-4-amino-4, 6-dideoxy-N-acetyl-beta-L-altrosamine N-acetyltransferase n=1 Tax=Ureibacillus endophyticus TaxID=1978490 RepID=UPI00209E03DF|nr:UDP-4-amino-4,6-dideoxy-N-acetyl-beta-L-altrosamine N-acetyltransferase [Lysinibacillus endophyticus]MCP1143748.1 UDP-4-amino-4,6-dideoxy-N-acetyl-beta-L-altrosamine N-acetyltransferase [Lysinibacillus endophyticus]